MELYNGDCLEVMQKLIDDGFKVDMILTDPPYGINAEKGSNGIGVAKNRNYDTKGNWDKKIPDKIYFDLIGKLCKKLLIFGGNYFTDYLPSSKGWVVWDKVGEISFKNNFANCELIYANFLPNTKKITFIQQGFIKETKDKRFHPTQKPTELLTMLIEKYTNEGDVVLDPFMGSGSTGVACLNTNRDFIGIELDKGYFDIAKERIEKVEEDKQLELLK